MPTQPNDGRKRPNARARAAALREEQRKKEARRRWLTIGGIVGLVVVIVIVFVVVAVTKKDKKVQAASPAPAGVVKDVTTIPASVFEKVDTSKVSNGPKKVSGSALTYDGKPGLFYLGAEYCPFCAAERWPLVVALSRFGTWSNLQQTVSGAAPEPFPETPTFSFYGAKYSSPYLGFRSVETQTNQKQGNSYTTLETPTAEQNALVEKYDGPNGSIPFIDFGNKFTSSGASYDPTPLTGKSMDEIAAAVKDPTSDVGKSVLGVANVMTATICETTGGKPANVCDAPNIKKIRSSLGK